MCSKKIKIFSAIILLSIGIFAQDTLTIVQYNLLNYGFPVYGCDNSNNNPDDKDSYLRTIFMDLNPDIFTVNELRTESYDSSPADRILDNVLNIHFNSSYRRANITNLSDSHIINMLYYNSNKFTLYAQDVIPAYRDINIYHLYYNSINLETTNDTAFIHCIVTHLKSSQGADNEAIRAQMTNSIMEYLETTNLGGNVLILGDFNVYSDQEQAFQNLINPENEEIKFYDPIEQIGSWHENANYSNVHTQSTHESYNDCASSGGMDDRFDFILMDKFLKDNLSHFAYVAESYVALGNDGTCYNESLTECDNSNLSNDLVNALYNMSDHLPIILKLTTDLSPSPVFSKNTHPGLIIEFQNPVKENLNLKLNFGLQGFYSIQLLSMYGDVVLNISANKTNNSIPVTHIKEGLYILRIAGPAGRTESKKLVITK
ncbi:T9SS type A sorting domain-containing protein [Bacteroidota bacterium]